MRIDPYDQDWMAQLTAAAASLKPPHQLHMLVDAAFVPGLHRSLPSPATPEVAPRLLFEALPSCGPETQDVSPLLLLVDEARLADKGFKQWLSQCDGLPMLHAIVTTDSIQAFGMRLEQWCVVHADGDRFNFRFPDTRRIAGIYQHLNPSQRAHLVGPATSWHYMGRDGRWKTLPELPMQASAEPLDTRLTAQQFAALLSDSEADSVLLVLDDRGYAWTQPHSINHATVQTALDLADRSSLDEPTKVNWCEACLSDSQLLNVGRPLENLQRWLAENVA
jgi:hypothetical protein